MDYHNIYKQLITKRLNLCPVGYSEKHHILPKSLGGSNKKQNLVRLTAREHFIAHLLLTKMYPVGTPQYHKMVVAFLRMLTKSATQLRHTVPSHKYAQLKQIRSQHMSLSQQGKGNINFGTKWAHNPTLRLSKSVKIDEALKEGWYTGRVVDWCKYDAQIDAEEST